MSFHLSGVHVGLHSNFKKRFDADKLKLWDLEEATKQTEHSCRKPRVASSRLCSPTTTEPETDPVTSPEWLEIRNHSQVI